MSIVTMVKICPKCGSHDLYETHHRPPGRDASFLQKLIYKLGGTGINPHDPRSRAGTVYVVCRQCGEICYVVKVM